MTETLQTTALHPTQQFLSSFAMELMHTTMALLLAAALVIKLLVKALSDKRMKKKYHPVVGTVFHHLVHLDRVQDFLTEHAHKHTSYRLLNLPRRVIYTVDPANVEYILKTNFTNYGKGWYHYDNLKDLLGDGIFAVDGQKWQHQRKMSSYELSTRILKDFSSAAFITNAIKLAHVLSEAACFNHPIEIQSLFMKSALDTVFKIILGIDSDSMGGTNEEDTKFSIAFDEANAIIAARYTDLFWKMKRFLNIGSEAVLRRNIKVVNDYVYKVIRSKTEQVNQSKQNSAIKKGDILSRFLDLKENDPNYLKDIILSFIIAGKDTTAVTLSWFFYLLCKHPRVQENIAKEVIQVTEINDNSTIEQLAASLTEENLNKFQYLHASLTETLRLYPPVPLGGKLCFSDDTWPDGFNVEKGDLVFYLPYAMGRMKFIWGNDAEEFRPERWLNENGVFQQESPFKFTAFQAGPRICLGKEFAYRQMKIFAAILLGKYRFKLRDEKKVAHYRRMLTLNIEGGLYLYVYPRLM